MSSWYECKCLIGVRLLQPTSSIIYITIYNHISLSTLHMCTRGINIFAHNLFCAADNRCAILCDSATFTHITFNLSDTESPRALLLWFTFKFAMVVELVFARNIHHMLYY